MALRLSSGVMDALTDEAECAYPRECCGLLLGEAGAITAIRPAANVHPEPATRFEIDARVLIDAHRAARGGGSQVLGCYHSHPAGPPEPSRTDCELAAAAGEVWAIVGRDARGGWRVRFWRSVPGGFQTLPSPGASR